MTHISGIIRQVRTVGTHSDRTLYALQLGMEANSTEMPMVLVGDKDYQQVLGLDGRSESAHGLYVAAEVQPMRRFMVMKRLTTPMRALPPADHVSASDSTLIMNVVRNELGVLARFAMFCIGQLERRKVSFQSTRYLSDLKLAYQEYHKSIGRGYNDLERQKLITFINQLPDVLHMVNGLPEDVLHEFRILTKAIEDISYVLKRSSTLEVAWKVALLRRSEALERIHTLLDQLPRFEKLYSHGLLPVRQLKDPIKAEGAIAVAWAGYQSLHDLELDDHELDVWLTAGRLALSRAFSDNLLIAASEPVDRALGYLEERMEKDWEENKYVLEKARSECLLLALENVRYARSMLDVRAETADLTPLTVQVLKNRSLPAAFYDLIEAQRLLGAKIHKKRTSEALESLEAEGKMDLVIHFTDDTTLTLLLRGEIQFRGGDGTLSRSVNHGAARLTKEKETFYENGRRLTTAEVITRLEERTGSQMAS